MMKSSKVHFSASAASTHFEASMESACGIETKFAKMVTSASSKVTCSKCRKAA